MKFAALFNYRKVTSEESVSMTHTKSSSTNFSQRNSTVGIVSVDSNQLKFRTGALVNGAMADTNAIAASILESERRTLIYALAVEEAHAERLTLLSLRQ